MDAISNNDANRVNRAYNKLDPQPVTASKTASIETSNIQLTDISGIAERAATSGDEIRPEVIKRAKALLADPNWLNDSALEGLADKLLSTEDFSG